MRLNIGYSFIRYVFFMFNIVFWILGCGSFGVGIWLYVVKADYTSIAAPNFGALSAAALYVAAGATIIVVGFVGCCGAWVESKCLLITYFVLVLLVFVVELTAGILAFLYKSEMSEVIRIELRNNLQNPYVAERARDSNGMPVTWDSLQSQFKCCGVESYEDWFRSDRWSQNNWVPDSCCDPAHFKSTDSMENCGKLAEKSLLYQQGCYEAFTDWLLEHMHVVGIIGILLAFIQIFGLIASVILFCGLRERDELLGVSSVKPYSKCRQSEVAGGDLENDV